MKVQLFAGLAERVGQRELELPVTKEVTVQTVRELIGTHYPNLREAVASCMVAVNQEYAADEERVSARDDVVLIPPVSGG
ncbi:molybdopterin converting factor subunit 1 [Numidum massiliense]|uniref:molybdopterin converting factor subunit 1 n=1 Tax=Numidum massiliense TaxID=1522315 RepID=UPI0006D5469D|nr:molybdopterin converting factor subunit 1 [Numidum massiliense]